MLAKRFALAFGIAIVFPAMIHCGVRIFSSEPTWRDYVTPSAAQDQAELAKMRGEEKIFEKHLFAFAVPLGLIAIAAGAFLRQRATGAGLMFGGLFSGFDGAYNYWADLPAWLQFTALFIAFVELVFIGWRKLDYDKV